ncbi:dihydrolipoyllysine-residue succinyltransferase [Haloferula sp. A504]|uniref:dihydrolipoyllysine-residue succinyltransferase n=1 Tax=Haloferula sp. A504 TaxID=3373601 RepID=UPI0031C663FA|nr:dihydrolipoyllysine-residue succinyltransferase [Verrucomicrobiaceae bacterium E54]
MATEVKVPAAGESITSANVATWHKKDGESVAKGDVLVTLETDKVSNELAADVAGVLKIMVEEGEEVAIGTVIAEIDESAAGSAEPEPGPEPQTESASEPAIEEQAPAESAPAPATGEGKTIDVKVPAAGESITTANVAAWRRKDGDSVSKGEALVTLETDKVSTELEAEESGRLEIVVPEGEEVSIGTVIARITVGAGSSKPAPESAPAVPAKESSKQAAPATPEKEKAPAPKPESAAAEAKPDFKIVDAPAERPDTTPVAEGRVTRRKMSMLRRKIATHLVNAQQTAAILTTFNEADMSSVMKLRKSVQEDFIAKHGVKLGFMSFFVKAVVQALKDVPQVNGMIDGNEIIENHFYDVGVAIGTEKGLVVPVLRDCDQKSFAEIEQDIIDYAGKARDGKIQLEDLQGGVFTISNGGTYGSLLSTPILNPPQSGILGMHTIQQRPVAVDGKVEIRPMMYLALSYDHRLVDGKEAVTFLIRIKDCIENPTRLMLEM